jgi:hypothetical protein
MRQPERGRGSPRRRHGPGLTAWVHCRPHGGSSKELMREVSVNRAPSYLRSGNCTSVYCRETTWTSPPPGRFADARPVSSPGWHPMRGDQAMKEGPGKGRGRRASRGSLGKRELPGWRPGLAPWRGGEVAATPGTSVALPQTYACGGVRQLPGQVARSPGASEKRPSARGAEGASWRLVARSGFVTYSCMPRPSRRSGLDVRGWPAQLPARPLFRFAPRRHHLTPAARGNPKHETRNPKPSDSVASRGL